MAWGRRGRGSRPVDYSSYRHASARASLPQSLAQTALLALPPSPPLDSCVQDCASQHGPLWARPQQSERVKCRRRVCHPARLPDGLNDPRTGWSHTWVAPGCRRLGPGNPAGDLAPEASPTFDEGMGGGAAAAAHPPAHCPEDPPCPPAAHMIIVIVSFCACVYCCPPCSCCFPATAGCPLLLSPITTCLFL